jgi:hypothetical protein
VRDSFEHTVRQVDSCLRVAARDLSLELEAYVPGRDEGPRLRCTSETYQGAALLWGMLSRDAESFGQSIPA